MPEKLVLGGYIGMGVVRPETKSPNIDFEGIITFIQWVTNILK
jgi:hypothetical protein